MLNISSILTINIIFFILLIILYNLSFKLKLLDYPNDRKIHSKPIPIIGGLLIFFSIFINTFFFNFNFHLNIFIYFSSIIIILGLLDDIFEINPYIRLLLQIVSSLFIVYYSIHITSLGDYYLFNKYLFSINNLKIIGVLLTLLSVLCLVNAFNFIDGLDGLSSSLLMVSSITLYVFANQLNSIKIEEHFFLIIFFYYNLLFFLFNKSIFFKIKIFYGDSGSTFIGFIFSWVLIYYAHPNQSFIHPVLAIWCITLPIYDFLFVIFHRLFKKINPLMPDNNHIHHILLRKYKSQTLTLSLIILLSILLNLFGFIIFYFLGSFICFLSYIFLFILYYFVLKNLMINYNT